jgi:hypothetical protein
MNCVLCEVRNFCIYLDYRHALLLSEQYQLREQEPTTPWREVRIEK